MQTYGQFDELIDMLRNILKSCEIVLEHQLKSTGEWTQDYRIIIKTHGDNDQQCQHDGTSKEYRARSSTAVEQPS